MPIAQAVLEQEAIRFRAATEECVRLHPEDRFTTDYMNPLRGTFPVGCCKSTAWMFGHHLTRLAWADEISYVWGERGNETHGWLMVDGFIVDLTADQFEDENRKVIVAPDGESHWHATFAPHRRYAFGGPMHHSTYIRSVKIAELMHAAERGANE
jgi:hypothetical protein